MNGRRRVLESRLAEIMAERGITNGELAQKLGVTRDAVSLWRRGYGVTVEYALQVAEILELPVECIWRLRKEK